MAFFSFCTTGVSVRGGFIITWTQPLNDPNYFMYAVTGAHAILQYLHRECWLPNCASSADGLSTP
jgi:hypothetical protein